MGKPRHSLRSWFFFFSGPLSSPAPALGISPDSLIIHPSPSSFPGCLPLTQWKLFAYTSAAGKLSFTRYNNHLGICQQLFNPPTTPMWWGSTKVSSLFWEGRGAAIPTSPSRGDLQWGESFPVPIQCFNYTIIPSHISCSVSNVHAVSPELLKMVFL